MAVPAAAAQETEPPPPDEPLLWAYGADDLASLPYTSHLGLNTVMLELKAPLTPEESARATRTVKEAGEYGLQVIVGMPLTMPDAFGASLANSPYVKGVTDYVREVVQLLGDESNVIGWGTGDYLERELQLSDVEFRDYLSRKYGSLDRLQQVWGVKVPVSSAITLDGVPALDDELPFAAGMPSVDLADYQALKYREMMQFWADLVRDATGGKGLLLTGRVTLYRSLPLIPDGYDVIVLSMPPDLLEPDRLTHNVHAIDMARGVRNRRVVPCLRLFLPGEDEALSVGQAVGEWAMEAALHGAAGLSFEAPPEVLSHPTVQDQWREALSGMEEQPTWRSLPRGVAAILYEPYADGFSALEVPVYGYIKDLSSREPSDLVNAFKQGTRYGSMDYLTLADLADADLDRYSVIFAPMALDLPEAAQQRLEEYVTDGGVLVADVGAGLAQTGSWQMLPDRLARLFGVTGFTEMKSLAGNLTIDRLHPAFPSLPAGAKTTGDFEGTGEHGRRTGAGAYAVNSWAGFALVPDGTTPFARLAMSVTEDKQPTFAGILARDTGKGTALFATHRLWSSWMPQHRLFEPFHADLWQRRARVELLDAGFIAPAVEICESEDGSVFLYNPGRAQRLQVALYAAEHRVFTGAACLFSSRLVGEAGLRIGAVLATLEVPQHTSAEIAPSAIEVRPYEGSAAAYLTRYDPERIQMIVAGEGSVPAGRPGQLTISPGRTQRVRVTVSSGEYLVEPGSRHRVRTTEQASAISEEAVLTADEQGRLRIEATVAGATLTITPK